MKAAYLVGRSQKTNEKKRVIQETKFIDILSKVATVVAILTYVSYISQTRNDLVGNCGASSQPLVVAPNRTL